MDLQRVISWTQFLNRFRGVLRVVHAHGEDRWENDVEHSYQLAMLAWYAAGDVPDLDRERVLKFAMVHDLVEAYAGDTYFYADDGSRDTKKEREAEAARRIREEFPEFSELHELIEGYERREDKESRFVYALDKVQPVLQIYTNGGRTWREKSVTLEMLTTNKRPKVAESPEVSEIFERLIEELSSREKELFKGE